MTDVLNTEVINNTQESRYELKTDGYLSVADYRMDGVRLVITHVEVPPQLRGRGIAAKVMDGVVADAKERGLTIIPVCSYAATYMQRHQGE